MKTPSSSGDTGLSDRLDSDVCARYLKALAAPERLRIIQFLQVGPKSVGELAALLGRELAGVSHHLGVLRHAGLVQDQRQGKYIIYSLHPNVSLTGGCKHSSDSLDLGCCRIEWSGQ